ncbi:hypothetical protein ACFLYS_01725 [Chloroflexota bacterium]
MIDLNDKGFCIFGLRGGGKTNLAKHILKQYAGKALIYDTLHEYDDAPFDNFRPTDRQSVAELENITRLVMKSRRYKLFIIDETNRYCPAKPKPLPQAVADLNDWQRHYGISTGYICRRPSQLNGDLTELAAYLFIFKLTGKNDIQYLNDIAVGMGDAAAALRPFHYILAPPDRGQYQVKKPVPEY